MVNRQHGTIVPRWASKASALRRNNQYQRSEMRIPKESAFSNRPHPSQ
jgi:hypothetical protein